MISSYTDISLYAEYIQNFASDGLPICFCDAGSYFFGGNDRSGYISANNVLVKHNVVDSLPVQSDSDDLYSIQFGTSVETAIDSII